MLFAAVAGILENEAADAAFASGTMFAASSSVAASEDLKFTIRVPSTKKWSPTSLVRGIRSVHGTLGTEGAVIAPDLPQR
jgi:hypothetical protein